MANNSPQVKQMAQLQAIANDHSALHQQHIQKKENNTGLPDALKTGIEKLSGMSMDDVKVHHNSDKPAQLQAHAYAQGTEIHLASGQEKHLPHEAWHVVQQKQGRVKPTMQMKGKVNVNDDAGLEKEADVMGAKALSLTPSSAEDSSFLDKSGTTQNSLVQRRAVIGIDGGFTDVVSQNPKPEETAFIEDQIVRRFKDQAEFEKFAQGQKLGVAGELEDKTWIRVDRFTILGEDHSKPLAPGIIKALGTNRFRYEGFTHFSETRKGENVELNEQTKKDDDDRYKKYEFGDDQRGQTHEAEHVLPKYARMIPDVEYFAGLQKDRNADKKDPDYVPIGEDFPASYGYCKTVIKGFLDALIYAKSYQNKIWWHDLQTFYKDHKLNVDDSIERLSLFMKVNKMPYLKEIKAFSDDTTFKAMKAAYRKEAMDKEDLDAKKFKDFKDSLEKNFGSKPIKEQGKTPEANEMDLLRDHSLLNTIKEAKSNDLLFIIGFAHQQKLRNKVGDIPIMLDEDFIKKEGIKNKKVKYGVEANLERIENSISNYINDNWKDLKNPKKGKEVNLIKTLEGIDIQWEIDGKVFDGPGVDGKVNQIKAYLVPPAVKERCEVFSKIEE